MAYLPSREEQLGLIEKTAWDIVVVGGGITGAGILREAIRRGLKVLLLEQKDFSWGTSSRSSKMVHGGLRYLKEGNFALTRESVREREILLRELPDFVKNKIFILPYYKGGFFKRLSIRVGLLIYSLLSGKLNKQTLNQKEMEKRAPSIIKKNPKGGFIINDAVTDDSQLVLRTLAEAVKEGGVPINYMKVKTILKEQGKVSGVVVEDQVDHSSYKVQTKLVVNATGAWADTLRNQVSKQNKYQIRPLRGSHIILPVDRIPLVDNISLIHPRDGRPVMALEWEGRVLVGTTDIDHSDSLDEEAQISKEETEYLLEAVNYQFPDAYVGANDIISTMAGIRPVIDSGKSDPSKESRDHAVWNEQGLLTVTGGKLTTFRAIALDVLRKAQKTLGEIKDLDKFHPIFEKTDTKSPSSAASIDSKITKRLRGRYGRFAEEMFQQKNKDLLRYIPGTETTWIELKWSAENSMVVHLDDLLLRRTRIGLLSKDGASAFLPEIKNLCQSVLGWPDEKWNEEQDRYLEIWKKYYHINSLPN